MLIGVKCMGKSLEAIFLKIALFVRMDFIPGIDGPSEGVARVLAFFSNNLLRREPLKLVHGGQSHRTFVYIKDAIEAVMLMIVRNPARANGHIFNVGNPHNEVTVRQLGEMMTESVTNVPLAFSAPIATTVSALLIGEPTPLTEATPRASQVLASSMSLVSVQPLNARRPHRHRCDAEPSDHTWDLSTF
ncbi:hypothetical protein DVH24_013527 [Malus domestica]|uniref:NAD-dependent epimerase/dehydratase domain-containing protein n=1 Tax=Malus domestica TaxID=3750 RepID=A0A498HNP4_MALDO|nr:hypothetical protein DVH24_013527 [Malus domestica]